MELIYKSCVYALNVGQSSNKHHHNSRGEIDMFAHRIKLTLIILILTALILAGCGLPAKSTPTPVNAIQTAAAATVMTQLTEAAATGVVVIIATTTPTPLPASATPTPAPNTATPIPAATNTTAPTSTSVAIPCDRATFVKDVTFPDDSEVTIGTTFVKTWRLKNNGTCTWNSSYSLVFDSGDSMLPSGSASSFQLTTGTVAPGQEIDVSVSLKAPDKTGSYQGNWKLRNGGGLIFGIGADAQKAFWVKIKAVDTSTPTPSANVALDFIAKGSNAEWFNGNEQLPWGDPGADDKGVAATVDNVKLNDGKTQARVLATYPERKTDGIIYGVYPDYTVQDKDHFKAKLGFRSPCDNGNVKFQIKYREGASESSLGEWIKSCDDKLLDIDIDLAGIKGKTVKFILQVSANGDYKGDKAVWVAPRVER